MGCQCCFRLKAQINFVFNGFFEGQDLQKMDRTDADQVTFPFGEIKKVHNYMVSTNHRDWKNRTPFLLEQLTLL